jgi:hypothetical protein
VVNETQIGGSAYSLGQKTMANSAPIVIASDQGKIPVSMAIPVSSDIINATSSSTGTLVVIPAGRTFYGSLNVSAAISVAGQSQPTIFSAGAGVVPTGFIHQVIAQALATSTGNVSNTLNNVYIFGGSAGATITFTQGALGASSGEISGILL